MIRDYVLTHKKCRCGKRVPWHHSKPGTGCFACQDLDPESFTMPREFPIPKPYMLTSLMDAKRSNWLMTPNISAALQDLIHDRTPTLVSASTSKMQLSTLVLARPPFQTDTRQQGTD